MREDETEKIAQARVGTVINGKWTVEALIGVGGMASVYAATHRNSKRAALKIMHPELSAQASVRERFLREGYLSNLVDHPGVVTVDDDDITEDGCAFLVMELVEGETLEARLRRKGPLPPEEVLTFMDQVLHALATAHTRGVVHRDLKPENILLSQNGEVKLLDFGIARARALSTDPTKTLTEGLMGTPAFMPPEQARGRWEEVDAQSDVWALGATMFTLLTGRNVHCASTTNEALAVAMMRHAPRLEEYRPDLPASLLEVVNTALSYDKKDRWPNATVMLLAVRRASQSLDEEQLEAEAVAAARALNSDSEPEVYFSEGEGGSEDVQNPAVASEAPAGLPDAIDDTPAAELTPVDERPTNPVSSTAPFRYLESTEVEATNWSGSEPDDEGHAATARDSAPWSQPSSELAQAPAASDSSTATTTHDSTASVQSNDPPLPAVALANSSWAESPGVEANHPPSGEQPAEEAASHSSAAERSSALPARRVVPYSDVPASSPGMARPTETTTARSAMIAPTRGPKRSRSVIGAVVVVGFLLLLVGAMVVGGGDGELIPAVPAGRPLTVPSAKPAPSEPAIQAIPERALSGPRTDRPTQAADSEVVDSPVVDSPAEHALTLDALPMLSASAEPSAKPPVRTRRWWPTKPKPAPEKTQSDIFNQARDLAVKRATVRSGNVKSGDTK